MTQAKFIPLAQQVTYSSQEMRQRAAAFYNDIRQQTDI